MDELVGAGLVGAGYPKNLERTGLLKDGTQIYIRPIRPEDAPRLADAYSRLSKKTAYQRFFTLRRHLPPDWARYFASVDYRRRMALIAERETVDKPELIGVGRYDLGNDADPAEIALVVLDGWQGRGLGTMPLPLYHRICTWLSVHAARRNRRRSAVAFWTLRRRYS